ncbi:TIGR02281 family clan AA aspartic protease [Parasphingopyxis algicola]|uniref:retropepsin-like aspartic protease family protein n=1 Tax=Parasphingopyxis algicola TaxID=2026624 RepID=UPI0015A16991|nr:TIGR02281 family clan AA aspartic protease [Parasphingopyxis algicola]QLC24169.1 TIGR02281 family clan AA aspartic protease [Parasphingopyxis algicola]
MSDGQGISLVWAVIMLVIVVSALASRRIPLGQAAKMAVAWIAIFAIGLTIYAFRNDIKAFGQRIWYEIDPPETVADGEALRIRKSPDGHFWVDVRINGNEERFLIDSGATVTALSVGAATRSGVEPGGGFPMILNTANGAISADRARAETLIVGTIRRDDMPVVIAEEFGGTNVLGMNFLSSLSSWSVQGDWLVLEP